jgi:nitroreductase
MICGNQEREKFRDKGYWQLDGAAAAENILVAAHAVGLGAVWTAIYPYPDRMAAVKKLLNLPEQVVPLTIIPIGYPAEQKPRRTALSRPGCTKTVGEIRNFGQPGKSIDGRT